MLGFWVKFKEIQLYVEHEVNNLIIVGDMLLLTTGESDVERVEVDRKDAVEGVKVDGEGDVDGEGNVEGVDIDGGGVVEGGDVESVQTYEEGDVEGVQAEANEHGGGESDGVDNVAAAVSGEEEKGIRLRYGTQMNMAAWLGSMKMKNIKMVREGEASFPYTMT
ncbi:hypothetical protein Gogos_001634, partial [Gossypium gossypioides]|nr:hypothetical protein [Gossypium gossypioides]